MKFSIILPIYNVEKYLRQCIDSILSQSCKDFEIILVDDGSKDSSGQICDQYAETNPKIKVIHKTNGGLSDARNAGLKEASGEYVFFIDSDDYLIDDDVLAKIETNTATDPDIIAFSSIKWYEATNTFSKSKTDLSVRTQSDLPADIFCELIDKDAYTTSAWSKVIKRKLLTDNNIEFEKGLLGEDNDWYYKVVSVNRSLRLINLPLYVYRQREGSITHTYKNKNLEHLLWIIEKWTDYVFTGEMTGNKTVIRNNLAKQYCNALIGYSMLDKNKDFLTKLKQFNYLLQYSNNPRVRIFRSFNRILTLNSIVMLLKIYRFIKK